MMRAVVVTRLDGPSTVEVVQVDDPQPGLGEVLIDVHASGVTFPDVLLTRGQYQLQPERPFVLGSEVAGIVRSAPPDSHVRPGDRVAAIPHFGGHAELVATDARLVFPLPERLSFATGAAIPMNYLTVEYALTRRGRLQPGETVLVHGAAGGIGTAAIQLAGVLGAQVIAVVSTPEKAEVAAKAGANEVVYADAFRDGVADLTGGQGVDMVLDPVGGDRFTDSLRCLKPEGRLLVVGFTGGEIPTVKVNRLLIRDIAVIGVAWGRPWWQEMEYLGEQWTRLLPYLESGVLAPVVDRTFDLDQAADAIRVLDERRARGKVILQVR